MSALRQNVAHPPLWARAYLRYERMTPNHRGKRSLLRLLLRAVSRLGGRPFPWRMQNGAVMAISPLEGLAFAWTVGWTCFQKGVWEPHVERCLRDLLRPGDIAFDIGANFGYFTAVMAQSVGPTGHVWAFEPIPATLDRLRLCRQLNGFGQLTALPFAVGGEDGIADVVFDPRFAGNASIHRDVTGTETESHTVPMRRLDTLVADGVVSPPDLMKIDVEGHELEVIRGARQTIAAAQPMIIFEFNQELAERAGWGLEDLDRVLSACGDYRYFEIRDETLEPIQLATFAPDGSRYVVDILASSR